MKTFKPQTQAVLEKPIIIFGTGRSGTTIISDIIFQHEDLAWHSNYQELFPSFAGINYLRRLFDNQWWRFIGMNTQNNSSIINQLFFRPIERYDFWEAVTGPRINFSRDFLLNTRATEEEKNRIRCFFAKMVKYQQRKRLAFKITGPSRIEYLSSVFPDAVFVNIVRDPIATVRSWLEVDFWQNKGKTKLWWVGAYTSEEEEKAKQLSGEPALITAFQYKKLMETTAYEIQKLGAKVYTVKYEDFVANPTSFISNLMNYFGLSKSRLVDKYLSRISVSNRNNRAPSKNNLSEETKRKILQIVTPAYVLITTWLSVVFDLSNFADTISAY